MKNLLHGLRFGRCPTLFGCCALLGLGTLSHLAAESGGGRRYLQTDLVSDVAGLAAVADPNLVNPWGLSVGPTGAWWVADNGTGLSTLYDGAGAIQSLVVTIPNPPGVPDPSAPTGTVFNGSTDFAVAAGKPAKFIFDTEGGTIVGWSSGTSGVLMVDNSSTAVYKGLAIGQINGANVLYAANFKAHTVDVFDATYQPMKLSGNAFRDELIPPNYAPFNVQSIGGSVYVAFAQTDPGSIDEVDGQGRGFVDAFSADGVLQRRLEWGVWFNAPWGIALAPSGFGRFSGMILVGQFGSGKIAAFDPSDGRFRGMVRVGQGKALQIDGLWALAFGNGSTAGPTTTLFFTAGPDNEAHGLFGTITPQGDSGDQGSGQGPGS
jgi:uncharacterized protein (TIGR03118 family)